MASGDLIGVVRVSTRLTAAPTVAVKELEQRLGGLIATRLDVNLNSLGASHLPPPSLDAYREYSRGLQYFRRDEYDDALRAFINARRADSTFFLPLVWAWYAAGNAYHFRMQDSLIAASRKLRDRLSPLDRYAFDAHASTNAEEERVATAAAARIAPGSNWSFMLGSIELSHLHAKAAIKALSTVDRAHGWARGWSGVDLTLMAALHLVGDYAAELAIADEAIARADTDGINTSRQGLEAGRVRALAGIGDTAALHAGIARLISISGRDASDIWEIEDTDMTLLYHGWRREADAVAKYAQREARKLAEKDDLRPERALVAEQAYLRWDLPVARSLAERSLAIDSLQRTFSDPDVSRILAVIAAIENRPAAVERQIAFARMATQDSGYPSYISARDSARQVIWNKHNRHLQGPTYTQACVAAVRGDAVTAANRLRDAIEKGMARPFAVLMDPCFRPIRKSQEYRALFAE